MCKPIPQKTDLIVTLVVTSEESAQAKNSDSEFERLMQDLATGSEDAAWIIAETYTPHILRAVRRALPDKMRSKLDSQDFAQIVWASLLLKRTYLKHVKSPDQLIDLLAKVAQYKVIDAFRRYVVCQARDLRRESPLDDYVGPQSAARPGRGGAGEVNREVADRGLTDRSMSPSQIVSTRERWQLLVASLSHRDREILNLRIAGQTYQQIASALSISGDTAKRVVDRIILQVRK